MIHVVLDTNIIVSAVLKPLSIPSSILHICLTGKGIRLCISKAILKEYKEVLLRPKFNLKPEKVKKLINRIKTRGLFFESALSLQYILPDPSDHKFLECSLAGEAHFLITGNTNHFLFDRFHGTRIVKPVQFLHLFMIS